MNTGAVNNFSCRFHPFAAVFIDPTIFLKALTRKAYVAFVYNDCSEINASTSSLIPIITGRALQQNGVKGKFSDKIHECPALTVTPQIFKLLGLGF
jgi:hypothetical protein